MNRIPRLTTLTGLSEAAECLRTIAHPHRLRMIQMLRQGQFSVGELAEACEISGPIASEHLRLMQHCSLLRSYREGRKVFYHIVESHIMQLLQCIEQQYGVRTDSQG
ncbi:MAG: ArsR/SmtB family transcription factor [Planctomycetota bacterium]